MPRSFASAPVAVDLLWIPLGAGGARTVRRCGRVYEAIDAARHHRPRRALYHAALLVELDGERVAIEVAPSPDRDMWMRGTVATGAVGSRLLGRWRVFRYEVRCWPGGTIPDLAHAAGRCRLSADPDAARRVLAAVVRGTRSRPRRAGLAIR